MQRAVCRTRPTTRAGSRASRSCTTSCSTSAAPSGCSSSCARCGPRPTSTRRSTTSTGPRAGSPGASVHTSFLQRLQPVGPHLPGAAAALPGGDRVVRPQRLRPRRLELVGVGARGPVRRALGARELLPQPVPVRLERPRADALAPPRPGQRGRSCAGLFRRWRQWDWIAAQRTDRYVANSRTTQARIQRLLRPRVGDRPSAGRDRAVLARDRRRATTRSSPS